MFNKLTCSKSASSPYGEYLYRKKYVSISFELWFYFSTEQIKVGIKPSVAQYGIGPEPWAHSTVLAWSPIKHHAVTQEVHFEFQSLHSPRHWPLGESALASGDCGKHSSWVWLVWMRCSAGGLIAGSVERCQSLTTAYWWLCSMMGRTHQMKKSYSEYVPSWQWWDTKGTSNTRMAWTPPTWQHPWGAPLLFMRPLGTGSGKLAVCWSMQEFVADRRGRGWGVFLSMTSLLEIKHETLGNTNQTN